MTDQWKPVGGVFWRTSPNEQWLSSPIWIVLVVTALATVAVALSIAWRRKQSEWHLRRHIAEIGAALTLVYLVGISALTWGRIGTLGTMPLNEVGDFFAGAFGPVAFLWLVLGYLQQGDGLRLSTRALELQADELRQGTEALLIQAQELKNSVEQQSIMAAAATQQIQAQKDALDIQLREADNLHRARFSFSSSRRDGGQAVGAKIRTSLNITSMGADAFDVVFSFDPQIGSVKTGNVDSIPKGLTASIAFDFVNPREVRVGTLFADYKGIDGRKRREKFAYEINPQDPYVKIKQQLAD